MKSTYSETFIEQALVKLFSRGSRTVRSAAEELNVSYHTLKYWMKRKSVAYRQARKSVPGVGALRSN